MLCFTERERSGNTDISSFYVLSSICLCLEIGMCELGAQTSIFLLGEGTKKEQFSPNLEQTIYEARMYVKGPGIVICSIISQFDCKKVLVFTRVFPAFRPHFDYGFAVCHVCHSHFQPRVLAFYFIYFFTSSKLNKKK